VPYSLSWLADVLRNAHLAVVEVDGWKDRGHADQPHAYGVLCHHTGPGSAQGLIDLIRDGRGAPDPLSGPLSHLFLDEDGTFYVIAAGRCNHAGAGMWHGITAGNSSLIGIEARNKGDGTDVWDAVQMEAYARGAAAILSHVHADSVMCAGHKEYALPRGRKVDPSFDMVAFRQHVENIMKLGANAPLNAGVVSTVDPQRSMLRKGDQGGSVHELQVRLDITPDGAFGPRTEAAVKAFQSSHGLTADGLVGPKTWAAILKEGN
jgi:N-acetyl-anhydromuramyl-L-alanine amidase AmpD